MRTSDEARLITVSLQGFEREAELRNEHSEVFESEDNVTVVESSQEESARRTSWFDRGVVEANETDDEIFEDAILSVDPYNRHF